MPRVAAFMREVDEEFWKLACRPKRSTIEVAPCQHELAPIFSTANIATDHNQLTMEILKKGCGAPWLCQPCSMKKPLPGSIIGSGKAQQLDMATDTGLNLLWSRGDPR
jgi:glutamine synthetase